MPSRSMRPPRPPAPLRGRVGSGAFASVASVALLILLQATWLSKATAGRLHVLYPLYIDPPHTSWTQIASLARQYRGKVNFTVIANPDSGPDKVRRSEYVRGLRLLKASGNVKVVGYVFTGYGQCFNWTLKANKGSPIQCAATDFGPSNPLPSVYRQLSSWVRFYAPYLDGFFLDEFLPYGWSPERAGPAAVKSVLKDYADLYRYIKRKHPKYIVVGNPGWVEEPFKKAGVKVADRMSVEQSASYLLANSNHPEKGSLVNFPPGYGKAMIVHSVQGSTYAKTMANIQRLIGIAVKWGVTHFVAVRSYDVYPTDFFAAEVAAMSRT